MTSPLVVPHARSHPNQAMNPPTMRWAGGSIPACRGGVITRPLHGVHAPMGALPRKAPRRPCVVRPWGRNHSHQPWHRSCGAPEPVASRWFHRPPHRQAQLGAGSQGSPGTHPPPCCCFLPEGAEIEGQWMGKSCHPTWLLLALSTSWQGEVLKVSPESHPCGGTASAAPKSPWKLYPRMQKRIVPAAVLGSAQCSPCALEGPKKNPPKSRFGSPRGDQTPAGMGRGGNSGCNRPWEIPTVLQERLV